MIQVEETLAENSVVYGGGCDRRKAADRPAPQTLQIDFLSKVALVILVLILAINGHCFESWSCKCLSLRCCPTTTTSRSRPRSLPSRLLLDTRRVLLWTDSRHLKQTRNRPGQTDRPLVQSDNRLSATNRQDRIQGTQTHTPANTVFILAKILVIYNIYIVNLGASWALHSEHNILKIPEYCQYFLLPPSLAFLPLWYVSFLIL